jgi:hypothetical protein
LPPLHPGNTPPRQSPPPAPPEPSVYRGASPPVTVPPLPYRHSAHIGRLSEQPPFPAPVPLEGASAQSSGNTTAPLSRLETSENARRYKRSNSNAGQEHA